MTQFLPASLLSLFAPRDPVPYLPPVEKLPHEKPTAGYSGVSKYLNEFEDPKDTPPPTKYITKAERKEKVKKAKQEEATLKLEQQISKWNPQEMDKCTSDPFCTLFVGRINYDTTESKMRREFESYGKIKKIYMTQNKRTGKSRGYAFVEYESESDMQYAYNHADGKKIDGKRILVDFERGRTVKGWFPRRLGGGLGKTRVGGPEQNTKMSGREENAGLREERGDEMHRDRSKGREKHRHRDRDDKRGGRDRSRSKGRSDRRGREPVRSSYYSNGKVKRRGKYRSGEKVDRRGTGRDLSWSEDEIDKRGRSKSKEEADRGGRDDKSLSKERDDRRGKGKHSRHSQDKDKHGHGRGHRDKSKDKKKNDKRDRGPEKRRHRSGSYDKHDRSKKEKKDKERGGVEDKDKRKSGREVFQHIKVKNEPVDDYPPDTSFAPYDPFQQDTRFECMSNVKMEQDDKMSSRITN